MANKHETERVQKGNGSDTLLVIYVLRILRKYSSQKNPLLAQTVLKYLIDEEYIDPNENEDSQKKKIRRYLDTLCESYGKGCIVKVEGAKKDGYKWYYDASKDVYANEDGQSCETLSDVEIELMIDLISATKIINADSTLGMIEKLLKKTSLSDEDIERKLDSVKKERWTKNINEYLVETKDDIQEYIDIGCRISFIYEGNSFIVATPSGWIYSDGKCFLKAIVGGQHRQFLLDKIRDVDEADGYTDEEYEYDYENSLSNNTSLESLFSNIPLIKSAIKERRGIKFCYRSYAVKNNRVVLEDTIKNVLPHSLVFNDGKYYLIGIDKDATVINKVCYFRVDLIADLDYSKTQIPLSEWNKQVYETIQRAREVEKHPLMLAGQETEVQFLVKEFALDRVIDAFGTSPRFQGTTERVIVPKDEYKSKGQSIEDLPKEKVVKFTVRTTREEAFRWALANADAVELLNPQDLRYNLRRIATHTRQAYIKTMNDKVQENLDYISKTGEFKITMNVDEETAFETFRALEQKGNLGAVEIMNIAKIEGEAPDYFSNFVNTHYLKIVFAQNCTSFDWASSLTKVSSVVIFDTQIKDVSCLKAMERLRYVEIQKSPVSDLSVLKDHKHVLYLDVSDTMITDISFIENYEHLGKLDITGCPIEDYTPLLRVRPLDMLKIDERTVEALGMENLVRQHPDAMITVRQKIDNRKV